MSKILQREKRSGGDNVHGLLGLRVLSTVSKVSFFYTVVTECECNKFRSKEDHSTLMTENSIHKDQFIQSLGGFRNNFYSEL